MAARQAVEPAAGQALPSSQFDPLRLHYLQALARRAALLAEGPARTLLQQRLAAAEAAYAQDFEAARAEAAAALARLQARFPQAAEALHRHWECGDFGAMRRLGEALAAPAAQTLLAELVRHINRQPAGATPATAPPELKAVRQARSTWTRLRVDRQLASSLAKLPDNPGPLNSHRLVLRCLQRLQAIAPHYLPQLLSQLDTLVWLEQASAPPAREGRPRR